MKQFKTKRTKKIAWVLISLSITFLSFLIGIAVGRAFGSKGSYRPVLQVVGDVQEVLNIDSLDGYKKETFTYKEKKYTGVSVDQILEKAVLDSPRSKVFFVGNDGLTAEVDGTTLSQTFCLFSEEHGWQVINLEHPISSNIKQLQEMVVVSEEKSNLAVTLFTENENLMSITPGQLYMMPYQNYRAFEGKSEVQSNYVGIYTSHRILDMQKILKDMDNVPQHTSGTLFLENGKIEQMQLDGYLEAQGNQIHYVSYKNEYRYNNIRGFYLGDPLHYLTDVYYDMEYYLEKEEPVMLVYIDGMSHEIFEKAMHGGIIPTISNGQIQKALTVHTSVTNAGFAAMITGETPDVNGIHTRANRRLHVPSIFKLAIDQNIKTAFLEGDANILNTEITPKLHVNGDQDILESTKEAVEDGNNFIFVHLHELDELGHSFGPMAPELYEYLESIDKELKVIFEKFQGQVIITTDHGMHKIEQGGSHGTMCYEDMVIPIIYQEGGIRNE